MSSRIGRLRHRLTLEVEQRTEDGGGGSATAWQQAGEAWAAIEAGSGGESMAADRVSGRAAYLITIRYREDIIPAMRFRQDGAVFHILSALDRDGRRRFLSCQCERRDL